MVKLRKFTLADLDQVMEIEQVSFPKSQAYPKSYFEKYHQKYPEGFVVAKENEEIVGYTIGQPKNRKAEIISLAVKPDWRQRGVGIALTKFLIEHFQKRKVKEIFLHVRTRNQAAISFYQRFGFKISGAIKNYYRNGDNAYLMKREMGG